MIILADPSAPPTRLQLVPKLPGVTTLAMRKGQSTLEGFNLTPYLVSRSSTIESVVWAAEGGISVSAGSLNNYTCWATFTADQAGEARVTATVTLADGQVDKFNIRVRVTDPS